MKVKVLDYIEHLTWCAMGRRMQPMHLRRRGWVDQEKHANKLVMARSTLNSGAVNEDSDGRAVHRWRVECKQTSGDEFRLSNVVWDRLCAQADSAGEEPLLHVRFNRSGAPPEDYCVVRNAWIGGAHYVADMDVVVRRGSGAAIFLAMNPPATVLPEEDFKHLLEERDAQ